MADLVGIVLLEIAEQLFLPKTPPVVCDSTVLPSSHLLGQALKKSILSLVAEASVSYKV